MVPSTSYELAEAIRQADLLKPPQIAKLASEILPNLSEDPQELAFALVQRGWLTSYQAEQALQGKSLQLHLGGYTLLAPIGTGGMGVVFKAWQKRLARTVALKVIRPELMKENPGAVRRFKREAMAVAQLSHPNIVSIYDADEADGTHFIALEFVDGPDLERMVNESGPLPIQVACEYVRQAALGLQHAYEGGLVHRDVKPSNLLIARPEATRRVQSWPCQDPRHGPGANGVCVRIEGFADARRRDDGHARLRRPGASARRQFRRHSRRPLQPRRNFLLPAHRPRPLPRGDDDREAAEASTGRADADRGVALGDAAGGHHGHPQVDGQASGRTLPDAV